MSWLRAAPSCTVATFLLHLQECLDYDGLVLLKEPAHEQLTTAQIVQLHNEYVITRQLADVPGVRPVTAKA